MTLVDHWDVENLKFRIMCNSLLINDLFLTETVLSELEQRKWIAGHSEYMQRLENSFLSDKLNHCWIWQGPNSGKGNKAGRGYGRIKYRSKTHAVHRISYVLWNGPIPGKKQVDHICNNRLCCNPNHLQLVTSKKNHVLRVKRSLESIEPPF